MKAAGIFLLLLVWQTGFSQFTDSFEDGNFSANPPWTGNIGYFTANNGELQLLAEPVSGRSFLTTESASIDNATWQFNVRMAFNPSSSNYTEVYLVADSPDLSAALKGYLVRIGWTTDNVSLFRQDGPDQHMLIEGLNKRLDLSNVNLMVKVTRSAAGQWQLWSRLATDTDWVLEGSALDKTYVESAYFGLKCTYTSTRADKFSFDDILVTGEAYVDLEPPAIDTLYSISETEIMVKITEEIAPATLTVNNFLLNGEHPVAVGSISDSVRLSFTSHHRVENYFEAFGLSDLSGNIMAAAELTFTHYSFEPVRFGDIVFNEIMPDPTPPVDLPEVEYIEIINSSNRAIIMTEWSLSDRALEITLPEIRLTPDSIIVLCSSEAADLLTVTNNVSLDKWPSLNNSEDELWLRDNTGNLVDYLGYDLGIYDDATKATGGWSLERQDPYLPCSGSVNWRSSRHPFGGTPGQTNSVFERLNDQDPPQLLTAYAFSPDSVILYFSEPLGELPGTIIIQGQDILHVELLARKSEVVLRTANLEAGKEYALQVRDMADCSGNITSVAELIFVLPEKPNPGDLVINEILFNPEGEKHDYLEIYNPSPRYLSLLDLSISNGESLRQIGSYEIVEPGGYRVFSPVPEEILLHYPRSAENKIVSQELPAFNNESGTAVLRSANSVILDSIVYAETWHFAYLNDVEGIALERISPYREGTNPANWASASARHNYGTPGYVNSQMTTEEVSHELMISPKVIVPDADGRDDFTTITIEHNHSALLTLRVYNLQGQEIRRLANNEALAGVSYFTWDGTDDYGQVVPLGHYIIVADLIQEEGRTRTLREKLVVGTGY